eukprot:CAMPEP_0172330388 /NCGR_PEP_ID=MMETSP1058-20130122/61376_1 /TAXON_ID=83371 /ORGANISM="Detonula confervacea, Strain CCMP 353" /LENGTH=407 /DNA_ID=CAMNT_0013047599 /DNA_START=41 /DNA_END=1264 /DNA_ORIENTATION=-
MMPSTSAVNQRRQSNSESRRSSTGTGGSQAFFSLRYVDIKHGNRGGDSSSTLGSNKYSASTAPQRNQQWTTSDRAQKVAQDDKLHSLLAAEVEKSGVVTAAGYKAVHQKFLYSNVVDQAMNRTRLTMPARKRSSSSLFGSLVKSTFSQNTSNRQSVVAKKGSYGSDSSNEIHGNIAPRRSSQVAALTQEQRSSLLQEPQEDQDKMRDSFFASIERLDKNNHCRHCTQDDDDASNNSVCSQDSLLSSSSPKDNANDCPSLFRRESSKSLTLEDIFDGMEGPRLLTSPPSPCKKSQARSDALTDASATLSRLDSLFIGISKVNFDPDTINVNASKNEKSKDAEDLKSSAHSSEYSDTDNCGWLPWPERKDDDSSSNTDEDLLESFHSSDQECSFLPWPDVPMNNRARAA